MTIPQMIPSRRETGPMLFTECPLCDQPARIDEATGALDCAACAVHLELAGERDRPALAPAA